MFTSNEIAQRTNPGWSYGYGPMGSPQWKADAGLAGITPWGPGSSDAFVGGAASATSSIANTVGLVGMGAAAAGWGIKKLGMTVPGMITNAAKLGGFGMGFLPGMAIGFAPQVIGSAAGAIQNQIETNSIVMQSLGNRVGLGGPGGVGPSRAGLQQIGAATRELAQVPALMTEVEELNNIMKRMTQAGMMQGSRNITDFKLKFVQGVNMLKDMSMVLGSTLEEAASVAAELHRMGIVSAKDKLRLATGIQIGSTIGTGMSNETIAQTVSAGVQMAQSMGGKSRVNAAQGTLQTLQSLNVANQMGLLNEQKVADITGFTGEQGISALAAVTQQRVSSMMMESGLGQAMAAALGETRDGKFTGKLDTSLVEKFRSGNISKEDLMKMSSEKLSTKGGASSFARNKGTLSFDAAQAIGFEGVLNQIAAMIDEVGAEDENLVALVAKNFLAGDQGLADVLIPMSQRMRDVSVKARDQVRRGLEAKMSAAVYKRDNTLGGKFAKMSHAVGTFFGAPIAEAATGMQYTISDSLDAMGRFITGSADTVQVSDLASQSAQLNLATGRNFSLTPSQKNTAEGRALASMPLAVQNQLDAVLRQRAGNYGDAALEFSKLTTQAEKTKYLQDMVARNSSRKMTYGTDLEGHKLRRLAKQYNISDEQLRSAAAQAMAGKDTENAFASYSPQFAGAELTNRERDNLSAEIAGMSSNFLAVDTTTAFLREDTAASTLYLKVLRDKGKLPDGTSITEFNKKSVEAKKKILARFGIDEAAATDLISKFGKEQFMTPVDSFLREDKARASELAGKLLADREVQAAALLKEDFLTLQYDLGKSGNKDQASLVDRYVKGDTGPLMNFLGGTDKIANPTLSRAREALTAVNRKNLSSVTSETELLNKLGLSSDLEQVKAILGADAGDSLSSDERDKFMNMARTLAVSGAINTTRGTEGLSGDQRAVVKEESMRIESTRLMVKANTEFVTAVANAVGNNNLKDAANRVKVSAAYDDNTPMQ
jgi:hypothetical protein